MSKAENTMRRTLPWADDEYLRAGPYRLVYTSLRSGAVLVHLPGGRTISYDEAKRRFSPMLVPPKHWRMPLEAA